MEHIKQIFFSWLPAAIVVFLGIALLWGLRFLFFKRKRTFSGESQLSRQITMFVMTIIVIIAIILTLPIGDNLQGQILSFFGILVTAAIALSSTTFVGNAMAGLMLRAIENFRPGDFVRVNEHFGRVSERGFLHTEIQAEDRDLITLPNLYLVTNPVTVVRSSGTIISATVSLGYDVSHKKLMPLLREAAEKSKLEDVFVHILELGDFSVSYRVSGFLSEIKTLISARSRLRESILSTLHENKIEIVSPNFMNQRVLEKNQKMIPEALHEKGVHQKEETLAEEVVFDKADEAESKENLVSQARALAEEREDLEEKLKTIEKKEEKDIVQNKMKKIDQRIQNLNQLIEKMEKEED